MRVTTNFGKFIHQGPIKRAIYKPFEDISKFLDGFHAVVVVGMSRNLDGSYLVYIRNSWMITDEHIWGFKNHCAILFRNDCDLNKINFGETVYTAEVKRSSFFTSANEFSSLLFISRQTLSFNCSMKTCRILKKCKNFFIE